MYHLNTFIYEKTFCLKWNFNLFQLRLDLFNEMRITYILSLIMRNLTRYIEINNFPLQDTNRYSKKHKTNKPKNPNSL